MMRGDDDAQPGDPCPAGDAVRCAVAGASYWRLRQDARATAGVWCAGQPCHPAAWVVHDWRWLDAAWHHRAPSVWVSGCLVQITTQATPVGGLLAHQTQRRCDDCLSAHGGASCGLHLTPPRQGRGWSHTPMTSTIDGGTCGPAPEGHHSTRTVRLMRQVPKMPHRVEHNYHAGQRVPRAVQGEPAFDALQGTLASRALRHASTARGCVR